MPDQPGGTHEILRIKCPRCQGVLEREVGKQPVRCQGCKAGWPEYKEVCAEQRATDKSFFRSPSLKKVKTLLELGKTGVRGARSVAARARAASNLFGDIADEVKDFDGQESVKKIGESLEDIMSQGISIVEDMQDTKKGKRVPEPEEEEIDEKEGEK